MSATPVMSNNAPTSRVGPGIATSATPTTIPARQARPVAHSEPRGPFQTITA